MYTPLKSWPAFSGVIVLLRNYNTDISLSRKQWNSAVRCCYFSLPPQFKRFNFENKICTQIQPPYASFDIKEKGAHRLKLRDTDRFSLWPYLGMKPTWNLKPFPEVTYVLYSTPERGRVKSSLISLCGQQFSYLGTKPAIKKFQKLPLTSLGDWTGLIFALRAVVSEIGADFKIYIFGRETYA